MSVSFISSESSLKYEQYPAMRTTRYLCFSGWWYASNNISRFSTFGWSCMPPVVRKVLNTLARFLTPSGPWKSAESIVSVAVAPFSAWSTKSILEIAFNDDSKSDKCSICSDISYQKTSTTITTISTSSYSSIKSKKNRNRKYR